MALFVPAPRPRSTERSGARYALRRIAPLPPGPLRPLTVTWGGTASVQRGPGGTTVWLNGEAIRGETKVTHGDVIREGAVISTVVELSESTKGDDPTAFGPLAPGVYAGPTLRRALNLARAAARADLPMVIVGETGTGKERVARLIHEWSGRPGEFVAINCAAIPDALAESELFGFRRGSFTGAQDSHRGLLRGAERGTLLLDEVTELSLPLQAKLLRVLQESEVHSLGEARPASVDIRFLAASQMSLDEAVRKGRMRLDFRARLEGLVVPLPPLRERIEEIPFLFDQLWRARGAGWRTVDPLVMEQLCLYGWPLNVRELETLVRRLCAIHGSEPELRAEHLGGALESAAPPIGRLANTITRQAAYDPEELSALRNTLEECRGNVTPACARLRISRPRAYRMLRVSGTELAPRGRSSGGH